MVVLFERPSNANAERKNAKTFKNNVNSTPSEHQKSSQTVNEMSQPKIDDEKTKLMNNSGVFSAQSDASLITPDGKTLNPSNDVEVEEQ